MQATQDIIGEQQVTIERQKSRIAELEVETQRNADETKRTTKLNGEQAQRIIQLECETQRTAEREQYIADLEEKARCVTKLEDNLKDINKLNEEQTQSIAERDRTIEKLTEETQRVLRLGQAVQQLKGELEKSATKIQTQEEDITRLEGQLVNYESKDSDTSQQLKKLQERADALDLRHDEDIKKLEQTLQKLQGRVTNLDKVEQRISDVRDLQQRLTETESKHQADSAALEAQISSLQDDVVVWEHEANFVSCHAHGVMEQYSSWVKDEMTKLAVLASDAQKRADQCILIRELRISRLIEAINALTEDIEQA
jgi:chromosome segregation ATPase